MQNSREPKAPPHEVRFLDLCIDEMVHVASIVYEKGAKLVGLIRDRCSAVEFGDLVKAAIGPRAIIHGWSAHIRTSLDLKWYRTYLMIQFVKMFCYPPMEARIALILYSDVTLDDLFHFTFLLYLA